jgi:hypothetical protein
VTDKPDGFDLFNYHQFQILSPEEALKSARIGQVLLVPLTNGYQPPPFIPKPTLAISECNAFRKLHTSMDWTRSISFGIGDGAIGLPFDPLLDQCLAEGADSLERLPASLRAALDRRKVYVGYSTKDEYRRGFAIATAVRALVQSQKAVVVLPGLSAESFEPSQEIEIVEYHKDSETCTIRRHESGKEPLLRLIVGKIPSRHLFPILVVAEPETLCTGDASAICAVRKKAKIVYEQHPHKFTFGKRLEDMLGIPKAAILNSFQREPWDLAQRFLDIWASYPEIPHYDLSHLDAWPSIAEGLDALPPQPFHSCRVVTEIEHVPFDRPVFVPSDQCDELDPTFKAEYVADGFCRVTRSKKTPLVSRELGCMI